MLSLRQRADEDQEKMSRHNTLDFSNVDIVAPICLCGFVPLLLAVLSLSTVRVIINDNDTQRQIQSVETPIATFWKSRGFWASMSLSSVRVIIASFKCSGFHYPEADRCRSVGVTIDSTTIKPSTKNQIYHICVGKEDNISYHLAMTMTCKDKDKYKVLKHLVRVPNLYFGSIQYSWGTWLWNTQSRGFKYINYIWDLHSLFDLVVEPPWSNEPKSALQPHQKLVTAASYVHAFWEGNPLWNTGTGEPGDEEGRAPEITNYTSSQKMDLFWYRFWEYKCYLDILPHLVLSIVSGRIYYWPIAWWSWKGFHFTLKLW